MLVNQSTTGQYASVGGNPYQNTMLILPNDGNKTFNITNDVVGAVNLQPSGNADTPTFDNGGGMHINRAIQHGQGTIPVATGSDADRIMQAIYNAMHPRTRDDAGTVNNYHKYVFTIIKWDSDQTDQNGKPVKWAKCENCYFQTQPPANGNDGSSNSQQTSTWNFFSGTYYRTQGEPLVMGNI